MTYDIHIVQNPAPGTRLVSFCGDTLRLTLQLPDTHSGTAWVRTNIGYASIIREEIIREVEEKKPPLGKAWFDLPMKRLDERRFTVTLPLCEAGHFEAKCYFLKEGEVQPTWPPGPNTAINVEAADACCANIIYNAFVRQFGPNKTGRRRLEPSDEQCVQKLDSSGYTVIPPSGKFRDLIGELDFIIGELGCRLLMLLPIHPTPTTYARMGRFGSPYAALSFTEVDPALAEFDPHATPLEQFIELVDAVHRRNAKILIDIAINHTGWAARLHEAHPQWLVRSPEGRIEVPGAWGVAWEDLTKLDYSQPELWQYMADVFLKWCRRGVDGFRCDAGYMIPLAAWRYIVAKVRSQFPDVIFLLEGLGGKISVTRDLLNRANLNWAYSELFQNYDRKQIEHYLPEAIDIANTDGLTVHFAETHDNLRLAQQSESYARMRTALCALSSHNGAFGFANGVEWLATEKINVHDAPSLNWGATPNQVAEIRRLNHLLKIHPAFHQEVALNMHQQKDGNAIVLLRHHRASGKKLLIIVNLEPDKQTRVFWDANTTGLPAPLFYDLLSGASLEPETIDNMHSLLLAPGQVLCLSTQADDLTQAQRYPKQPFTIPAKIEQQRLSAKALEVVSFYGGIGHFDGFDRRQAVQQLKEDPLTFCKQQVSADRPPGVIIWQWPQDLQREVMLPPDHFLLIRSDCAFGVRMAAGDQTLAAEASLPTADGHHFVLLRPLKVPQTFTPCTLSLSVYDQTDPHGCRHEEAHVLLLPSAKELRIKQRFNHSELIAEDLTFLATNGRGAMMRSPVAWNRLASRYDGLLAANFNPQYPADRWIMFSRCRAWIVFQGYSQALNRDCLEMFRTSADGSGWWQYHVPTGQGQNVLLTVRMTMAAGQNSIALQFFRHPAKGLPQRLTDSESVEIILRPDIENRSFHAATKAYQGPENRWPKAVSAFDNGFDFGPDADHQLRIQMAKAAFVPEPEWLYMIHRPQDARRGHDPDSDLFSPGYLSVYVKGNQTVSLHATAGSASEISEAPSSATDSMAEAVLAESEAQTSVSKMLQTALAHYVVKRGDLKSVIAGYPWFLDWGRDALIFVRGLVAAGKTAEARDILVQFARFEKNGTLPNMIQAENDANRNTSDAPLWLLTACADWVQAQDKDTLLATDCGGRSLGQILLSIGQSLKNGAPNGVYMDPESGLIFSPTHFSWMDTNHPAGSPRQGYPIEIQALWFAALRFLAQIDPAESGRHWRQLAKQVQQSILQYFWQPELAFLSDCLHATPGQPASAAVADDALRPNQLLAITLGAIKDAVKCRSILAACETLLVPGAIRSLADRTVRHEIKIVHRGALLNDPDHPYWGKYEGDEDTRRKPAYHNGTAWTWMFPSYCEAWEMTYGPESKPTALAWLASGAHLLEHGCLGHIPEILDGDYPHTARGCDAQAWGASELLRVWLKLT
ncbi:MAG: amylo-alpha-1,6-glucosidase [Desulfobacterales bacterium]|nr:amylo-alpha-1,6-glucosidase [Desulfobacterales bacterium]